ncbi:MAG: hypothetical protein KF868_06605 [Acidobacteria bacterium]|nr:hypothetical protein [Acidobacteriota bacterium]
MEPPRHRLPAGGREVPTASESGVTGPPLDATPYGDNARKGMSAAIMVASRQA